MFYNVLKTNTLYLCSTEKGVGTCRILENINWNSMSLSRVVVFGRNPIYSPMVSSKSLLLPALLPLISATQDAPVGRVPVAASDNSEQLSLGESLDGDVPITDCGGQIAVLPCDASPETKLEWKKRIR